MNGKMAILVTLAAACTANAKVNDFEAGSNQKYIKGRFELVKDGDNQVLRVASKNKKDSARVSIPLDLKKAGKGDFTLNFDVKVNNFGAAGVLFSVSDWNPNKKLISIKTQGGKNNLLTKAKDGKPQKAGTYAVGKWMSVKMVFDRKTALCDMSITDKASGDKISSVKVKFNAKLYAAYLNSATWPGQSKSGYSFDLDNVEAFSNK